MRIYLAFFQTRAHGGGTANYGFWADMMRAGLREAGHTVLESPELDWAEGMSFDNFASLKAWRDRTWSHALADLARHQAKGGVDIFLGYFFPKQVEPGAVAELNRRGIPTVNFFCDNVREFRALPAAYRTFQLHWVPEWAAVPLYRDAGLAFIHAPMPLWIPPETRTLAEREETFATFLGSRDGLRAELFGRLAPLGVQVQVRGKGWTAGAEPAEPPSPHRPGSFVTHQMEFLRQHGLAAWLRKFSRAKRTLPVPPPADWLGGPVPRDEYLRLTRESAVTIGVNRYDSPRLRPGEIATYSRLRDLEAPMLGACYLTEWAPGLDQLYDVEREIATYRDERELAGQIKALLPDAPRRARMRRAAQARALREHTIGPTLKKIAATLGLGAPA
jgi:hypothetical protein